MSIEDIPSFGLIHCSAIDNIIVIRPLRAIFAGEQVREFFLFFQSYKNQPDHRLILDISQCDYASSEALGAITSCWQWHQKDNRRFALVVPSTSDNYIAELLSISNLDHTMGETIQKSMQAALAHMRRA
ncbi:MAG: STAS domain-containing protein [Fibrobacterota bacterium]